MGIEAAALTPLLIGGGFDLLSGLAQPNPFQERRSFSGSGADPTNWLTQGRTALTNTFNSVADRANQPIDLSGAQVQQPRSLQGGSMPLRVGLTARPQNAGGSGRGAGRGTGSAPRIPFAPSTQITTGTRLRGDNPPLDRAIERGSPPQPNPFATSLLPPRQAGPNSIPTGDRAVPRGIAAAKLLLQASGAA